MTTHAGKAIVASANKDGPLSVLDRTVVRRPTLHGRRPLQRDSPSSIRCRRDPRERGRAALTRQGDPLLPRNPGWKRWNGAAFHPALNTLYVGAVDWCVTVQLERKPTPPPAGQSGSAGGPARHGSTEAAKGWLTAFDADSGAVKWKFASPKPLLAGVTPTSGGLVFMAISAG